MRMKRLTTAFLIAMIFTTMLAGCKGKNNPGSGTASPSSAPTTEEPMALKVNGDGITLVEYQAELARLQQEQGAEKVSSTPEEQRDRVIGTFVDQLLLTQAAAQAGYVVDDASLQAHIDMIVNAKGGLDKFQAWESTYGYTDESFRIAERRSIAANWQMNQIFSSVPTTADQIHAQQILVQEKAIADSYYSQLQSGTEFAKIADTLEPTTGGDLGWFPKGTLTQPAVEDAAFALQPGQYSTVIQSELGYHIIYVIERDANHPLSTEDLKTLQLKKLDEWLQASKAVSTIEVLVQ